MLVCSVDVGSGCVGVVVLVLSVLVFVVGLQQRFRPHFSHLLERRLVLNATFAPPPLTLDAAYGTLVLSRRFMWPCRGARYVRYLILNSSPHVNRLPASRTRPLLAPNPMCPLNPYTREWRVTANAKKCAVVVCNEGKVDAVNFSWK